MRVLFNSVPEDYPIPGETTVYDAAQTIDLETVRLDGVFLAKTLLLSVDPFLRGMMRHPDGIRRSRRNARRARVINFIHFQHDGVYRLEGICGYQARALSFNHDLRYLSHLFATSNETDSIYLQVLSARACRLQLPQNPNKMVTQLAKKAGMKVTASAGSEEKLQFMKDIGADVAFNYKATDTREGRTHRRDRYWDNVGGEVPAGVRRGPRTVFSAFFFPAILFTFPHNSFPGMWDDNLSLVIGKVLRIDGVQVFYLRPKYNAEFYATIPPLLASVELKYREDVTTGLDTVGDVLLGVQKGMNHGKAASVVAEE
ncbi:hypothetical protein DFH07DRAFT_1010138, partial [Mycena maculata]